MSKHNKQRVVTDFLKHENGTPTVINHRLLGLYGGCIVDTIIERNNRVIKTRVLKKNFDMNAQE